MTEIKGYTPLSDAQKDAMNELKVLEEGILRQLDANLSDTKLDLDGRANALAFTHIQTGFMWANRAIAKPQRLVLPGDEDGA